MKTRRTLLDYDRAAPQHSFDSCARPQPWPRALVADRITGFCFDAPVLRREMDDIRERQRTRRGRAGDLERLHELSEQLAQLLCFTFAPADSARRD